MMSPIIIEAYVSFFGFCYRYYPRFFGDLWFLTYTDSRISYKRLDKPNIEGFRGHSKDNARRNRKNLSFHLFTLNIDC